MRRHPLRTRAAWAGRVCLALLAVNAVTAQERLIRRVGDPDGLPIPRVFRVVQDSRGFLWIGSEVGLVRYDGVEMRPWAADTLRNAVFQLAAGPSGQVVAVDHVTSGLYRVVPAGVAPVPGPDGGVARADRIAFDTGGRLWAASGSLRCREPDGRWREWSEELLGGAPSALAPDPSGGLLAAAAGNVWRFDAGSEPRRLGKVEGSIAALLALGEDAFVALQWDGGIWESRDGSLRRRSDNLSRGISLVRRGDAVWAGLARHLVRLGPEGPPRILDAADGLRDGGDLLVDREGSLWLATFNGLLQMPEPDTLLLTEKDGLPSTHARYVVPSAGGLWIGTWQGQAFLPRREAPAIPLELLAVQGLCVDRGDGLWTAGCEDARHCESSYVLARIRAGEVRRKPVASGRFRCATARGGGAWLSLGLEVLRGGADGDTRSLGSVGIADVGIRGLMEAGDGTLWAAGGESVCRAPVSGGAQEAWSCETVPGASVVHDILEVTPGEIWIGTEDRAVLRRAPGGWEAVVQPGTLRSRTVTRLVRSSRGGVWLLGPGNLLRVAPEGEVWTRVESLSAWNGVPASSAEDILEEDDGTLWVATWGGVVRVPPGGRGGPGSPPPVALIDVRVDGERIPVTRELRLPYRRNRIELHFAALSYRDPARLRYRTRLRAGSPWIRSDRPVFRYVDLAPGEYHAEVAASLDGRRWSTETAGLTFRVRPPWFRQAWAVALFSGLAAAALYGVHRLRVSRLVGLERQRARIAMDLHDEMGSGLGSIGMLAAVAAEPGVPDAKRRSVAQQIADTAEDLGGSLNDIVRALRPGAGAIDALAAHLVERGGRLFPGSEVQLATDFPEPLPRLPLSLAVRRNLLLIGSEALHNAARHAGGRRVVLGLGPAGRRWKLWVEDDGRGMVADAGRAPGLGLPSMRRRAEEIGATIRWCRGAAGGTRVEVEFDPRAEDRRLQPKVP